MSTPLRLRVVVRKSVAETTPELLRDAIAGKLESITALHTPRDEEPPRHVLGRLRVEREGDAPFGVWRLYWSSDERRFVRLQRVVGAVFHEQRREMLDEIAAHSGPETETVRDVLHAGREMVSFDLDVSDTSTMAWPVTLAAAASFALAGNGLVRVDGEGWLAPKGKEIETLIAEP